MNILILGAGAVGGYFGGRLLQSGADVTFLVRKKREEQLRGNGLVIKSVHGDFSTSVKTLTAGQGAGRSFDLIILSTKAYHFDNAIRDVEPYVSSHTMLLPLLNGYSHIETLQDRFGKEKVLGGLCFIESTLNEEGEIIHTSQRHDVVFGELNREITPRVKQVESIMDQANFTSKLSGDIVTEMWNKYIFITALSGMTTLFNSSMGPILESPYGKELYLQLLNELSQVALSHGVCLDEKVVDHNFNAAASMGFHMKSSMLRDMEKKMQVEAEHLQGEFLRLASRYKLNTPILKVAYNNLKVYEVKLREGLADV
ncbi:ketopantoate reductase family protein [Microaerobacter geothermalis]|uniref:ketopantoate reductase family protein n=1 Tax=Microaerobacter geothermalis TaxID=674972 RepID=UPI001F3C9CAA|nr:ketopantoate reductase family protein [Microaerobacter geothermalis]MCF6093049.1 ketopantoate reductase family protein [Microaerobacter geothermalis]